MNSLIFLLVCASVVLSSANVEPGNNATNVTVEMIDQLRKRVTKIEDGDDAIIKQMKEIQEQIKALVKEVAKSAKSQAEIKALVIEERAKGHAEVEELAKEVAKSVKSQAELAKEVAQGAKSRAEIKALLKEERAKSHVEVEELAKEVAKSAKSQAEITKALVKEERAKSHAEVEELAKEIAKSASQAEIKALVKEERAKSHAEVEAVKEEIKEDSLATKKTQKEVKALQELLTWIYYPRDSRAHRAKTYYPKFGLRFVGYGYNDAKDDSEHKVVGSLDECISYCVHKRMVTGHEWNGVAYYFSYYKSIYCYCLKNTSGLKSDNRALLYHFD